MASGRSENGVFVLLGGLVIVVAMLVMWHIHEIGVTQKIKPPKEVVVKPSDALDINVYVDGSGSIKNFLRTPPRSEDDENNRVNYVSDLFNLAEVKLHDAPGKGGWGDAKLRFWQFGSEKTPKPIRSGDLAKMSDDPTKFSERDTRIEAAITHQIAGNGGVPRPELKIILTDLYESDGDMEAPANALTDNFLKNSDENAVGVVVVRNPFQGCVEDLPGSDGKCFVDAADSMPFYVIFAGPAGDVQHAMEVLVDGTLLRDAEQSGLAKEFYFSRAPETTPALTMDFTGAERYTTTVSDNYEGQNIPFKRLQKGILQVTWSDPRQSNPDRVPVGGEDEIKAVVSPVGSGEDPAASQAVQPCSSSGPGTFCETIDRAKLKTGTTYVIQFDLFQNRGALIRDSTELQRWNIDKAAAIQISSMKVPVFPPVAGLGSRPGRTPDLYKFLSALQGQMFRSPVQLTSYYLYLQAK